MTEIIFATGNKDKMREIREIMADCDVHIVSMKEAGIRVDIVEDGTTFCPLYGGGYFLRCEKQKSD